MTLSSVYRFPMPIFSVSVDAQSAFSVVGSSNQYRLFIHFLDSVLVSIALSKMMTPDALGITRLYITVPLADKDE